MRGMMLAVGCILVAGTAAVAQAPPRNTQPGAAPAMAPAPAARTVPGQPGQPGKAGPGLRASADNEQARRLETERYKRWDDRMRRATRSMCDRC